MKKIFWIIFFFLFIDTSYAKELVSTSFVRCDSNDTFIFKVDDEERAFMMLGVKESDNGYACNLLSSATSTLIEYDNSTLDEYNRYPVWIWIDEVLLQEIVVNNGYAKVSESDYKYTKALCKIQDDAIKLKKGIWEIDTDKGLCASLDYSKVFNNIIFEEVPDETPKTTVEEISESLEKIDNTITNITDNNMDKIAKFYLYGFLALAFLVFVIKEIKK